MSNMRVNVPIFEADPDGAIRPNPLFHRPWDKLHSRCVEYPFAAAQAEGATCLLDVGTAKADPVWIQWLNALDAEVHATDFDPPDNPLGALQFHQADIRDLPLEDETFDCILAVSVIEHIGLDSCQVDSSDQPETSTDGDLQAVHELARILRPGGRLVMTFPYGPKDELILGSVARNYTEQGIARFGRILTPTRLDYYEYQHAGTPKRYDEYGGNGPLARASRLLSVALDRTTGRQRTVAFRDGQLPGAVTWRRLPRTESSATQRGHVDGVMCGVWEKRPVLGYGQA